MMIFGWDAYAWMWNTVLEGQDKERKIVMIWHETLRIYSSCLMTMQHDSFDNNINCMRLWLINLSCWRFLIFVLLNKEVIHVPNTSLTPLAFASKWIESKLFHSLSCRAIISDVLLIHNTSTTNNNK